eukprot:TCALIF_13844-PA protein Name:"Protein of unknown function" AED:0.09 eAED:0.29 QI:28/0/0/1/0/0/2/0/175
MFLQMSALHVTNHVTVAENQAISALTKTRDREWTRISWIPDTSSDVEAMYLKTFKKTGGTTRELLKNSDIIRNVSGVDMHILGVCPIWIRDGDRELSSTLHVFSDICGCYLSRSTLKELQYLPRDWPKSKMLANIIDTNIGSEQVKSNFVEDFADVFNEEKLKLMKGRPMKIQLV